LVSRSLAVDKNSLNYSSVMALPIKGEHYNVSQKLSSDIESSVLADEWSVDITVSLDGVLSRVSRVRVTDGLDLATFPTR